jgi:hypothetical protein
MHNIQIRIVLNIDPSKSTPDEAAEWAIAWAQEFGAATMSGTTKTHAGPIYQVDEQLGRLTGLKPVFAPRVRKVHQTLINIGYTPTLPSSTKKDPPPYISYIDPDNGVNFGNLQSKTFYVMRKNLRDELAALPGFVSDRRYAHCSLDSEHAVDALLRIAEREKN